MLFVAQLFTLFFNKCAARASDDVEDEESKTLSDDDGEGKEKKPTKRESASTRNTKMENPMFDAAGSSESDEEESPTGSFASAKAARKKQMQT